MHRFALLLLASVLALFHPTAARAAAPTDPALVPGATFEARDTLDCRDENVPDTAACLKGLRWPCVPFQVVCQPAQPNRGDWLLRFPSPRPMGDAVNDLVAMEWYMARDPQGHPLRAPAVVVVHESGRSMIAGRTIARGLCNQGFHTFLVQLPGYGERTSTVTRDMTRTIPALKQAVADVRRARDAVAALPLVDTSTIAVQGTSLGGFVVATVSGLDHGYDKSFILLAGGEIADVILTGKQDAARMHQRLNEAGVTDAQVREVTAAIEPLRLAHRVDPSRTWLFSGKYDDVVPASSSDAFAKAAGLDLNHHYILPVGHYSAALLLPAILPRLGELMLSKITAAK